MENIGIDIGSKKTILRGRNNRLITDPTGKRVIPTLFQLYEPIRRFGNFSKCLTKKDSLVLKRDFEYSLNKEYVMFLNYINSLIKGSLTIVIPQTYTFDNIKKLKLITTKLNMNLKALIDSTCAVATYIMISTNYKGNLLVIDFGHKMTECSYFKIEKDLNRINLLNTIGGSTIDDLLLPLLIKTGKKTKEREDQIINNLTVIKSILNTSDCIKTINILGDNEIINFKKEDYIQLINNYLITMKEYFIKIKSLIDINNLRIEIVGANYNNLYIQEVFKEVFSDCLNLIHFTCDLSEGVGSSASYAGSVLISGIKDNRKVYFNKKLIELSIRSSEILIKKEIELTELEIEIPFNELINSNEFNLENIIIDISYQNSIIYTLNIPFNKKNILSLKLNNFNLIDFSIFYYERNDNNNNLIINKKIVPFDINEYLPTEEIDLFIKEEFLLKKIEDEYISIIELRNNLENIILNFPYQLDILSLINLQPKVFEIENEFYSLSNSKTLLEENEKFDNIMSKLYPLRLECEKKFNENKSKLLNLINKIESTDLSIYTTSVYHINSLKSRINKLIKVQFDLDKVKCPKKLFDDQIFINEFNDLINIYKQELKDLEQKKKEEEEAKAKAAEKEKERLEKEKEIDINNKNTEQVDNNTNTEQVDNNKNTEEIDKSSNKVNKTSNKSEQNKEDKDINKETKTNKKNQRSG